MAENSKAMTWSGRVITGLVGLMLIFSGSMKFTTSKEFTTEFVDKLGYPADVAVAIGVVEISCAILYLVPQTSVLGALLLTAYLGGAVSTHVRVHDNFIGPIIGGVLVWLGIYLRDPRIRALLPIRQANRGPESQT